jgi:glycosyltransferase involved in cell wall biosynthesis
MNKKLVIWILQTGEPLHVDMGSPRPMRAMNLANALNAAGHQVVIWSSFFNHQEKKHRLGTPRTVTISPLLKIRLIDSPGYIRNIGLGRLWDHFVMAYNLSVDLKAVSDLPDIAFVGYPPIEVASLMMRWLRIRGIPSIVDIKDQWPAIFVDALPERLRWLGKILLIPYFYYGKRALRDAVAFSTISNGFLRWALIFANRDRVKGDMVVSLTSTDECPTAVDLVEAGQWWDALGVDFRSPQRFYFVGSHSTAFSFEPIVEAAKYLSRQGISCQFVICGSGPETNRWKSLSNDLTNIIFPGWVDRPSALVLAERSYASLAPYKNSKDFMASIPNKIVDSLSLGKPILSSLSGEVAEMIEKHAVGISYGNEFNLQLGEAIEKICFDSEFRALVSSNAKDLYSREYSYEKVYGSLVRNIERIARKI